MPPRLAVLAIVVFWLATTTWLCYREVLPEWRAAHGQPPAFAIDVADEIGGNSTSWVILLGARDKDQVVWQMSGLGRSDVRRQPDRSYTFATALTFTKPRLLERISLIESRYSVSKKGVLQSMDIKVRFRLLAPVGRDDEKDWALDFTDFGLRADVEEGFLKTSLRIGEHEAPFSFPPIAIPEQSSVLNPMQLGNKMIGLRAGQTWSIPLFNPLAANPALGVQASAPLLAVVSEEDLPWAGQRFAAVRPGEIIDLDDRDNKADIPTVPCFRVDFRKSGDDAPTAMIWVRQSDGAVLQQQLNDGHLTKLHLLLIRGA